MITIPDEYADILNDVRDTIYGICDQGRCITALNNILEDVLSHRDSEDWYFQVQNAKEYLKKAIGDVRV